MYASSKGCKPSCATKANRHEGPPSVETRAGSVGRPSIARCELERTCWDPKDGELWASRAKAGETLLEARNNTDVQIVCLTYL